MRVRLASVGYLGILFLAWLQSVSAIELRTAAQRGEYIFNAAGCLACHTATDDGAKPLAGGHVFDTPFGRFISPNITPHVKHGIGSWTVDQFDTALRHGKAPDGSRYYPVFPYTSYTKCAPPTCVTCSPICAVPSR